MDTEYRVLTVSDADGFYLEHEWLIDTHTAPEGTPENVRRATAQRYARDLHADQFGIELSSIDTPDSDTFPLS